MKKQNMIIQAALLLPGLFFLSTCQQAVSPDTPVDVIYDVKIENMANGDIVAVPDRGMEGTEIKFIVNPKPGFKLRSLQFHALGYSNIDGGNATNVVLNSQNIYAFNLLKGGVWVSGEFIPLAANEHSITLQTGEHGRIIVSPSSGRAGVHVRVYSYIDAGYSFKSGFPKLTGASWVSGKEGFEFIIGSSGDVTLESEFEKPDDVDDILASARRAMDAEEYDAAFSYYEIAYQVQQTNAEAVLYSTLGSLLSIGNNSKVRSLLIKAGNVKVPGTINNWLNFDTSLTTNWLQTYTSDQNDTYDLPRLDPPSVFPGGFLNYDIYQRNLGKRQVFDILLFWNMVGNNPVGFNEFLDDTLKYVFGEQFEEACSRVSHFPAAATVTLHPALQAKFNLDEIYGSGATVIGRADLEVLLAFLRSLKAAAEWLASYDWEMDLTLLRIDVSTADTLNSLLSKTLKQTLKERLEKDGNYTILSRFLPLRSHLLRNRNSAMMSRAKADFTAAVNLLDRSIDAFYGRFDPAAQAKYAWLSGSGGFARQLKSAADSGGNFYIPAIPEYKSLFYAMEGDTAWVSAATARHGVNLGKLFMPAYLVADKLITTESGGKAPRFFGFRGAGTGTAITDGKDIAGFDTFTLEFGSNFKDVFVKLKGKIAADYRWTADIFPDVFTQADDALDRIFAKDNVTLLYEHYQRR